MWLVTPARKFINALLHRVGLHLTSRKIFDALSENVVTLQSEREKLSRALTIVALSAPSQPLVEQIGRSRSQLGQDFFALLANRFKEEGFFVEFGACEGIEFSNTYLLEKEYGWSGILSEPNQAYHAELEKNRTASIDHRAVAGESGQTRDFLAAGVNGSFHELRNMGRWGRLNPSYTVATVSLFDLLREHGAPARVDFLSIDTEGSEYEILREFDFSSTRFSTIAIELNQNDSEITSLLASNGYLRVLASHSQWDGWYIDSLLPPVLDAVPMEFR
jgi:FkbM family methyltransferase